MLYEYKYDRKPKPYVNRCVWVRAWERINADWDRMYGTFIARFILFATHFGGRWWKITRLRIWVFQLIYVTFFARYNAAHRILSSHLVHLFLPARLAFDVISIFIMHHKYCWFIFIGGFSGAGERVRCARSINYWDWKCVTRTKHLL